jgi:hypothetical protein
MEGDVRKLEVRTGGLLPGIEMFRGMSCERPEPPIRKQNER